MQHFAIQTINRLFLEVFITTLRKYQYTHKDFLQRGINSFAYDQYDLPIFAYRYPASTAFGILFHLFFLGRKLKLKLLKQIFSDDYIQELFRINILEKTDSVSVRSTIFLIPFKTYYFACDFILQLIDRSNNRKRSKYESVYPIGLDSITLSEVSIKKQFNSVLDLGCGSGILSIIASGHSRYVTGIDLNPRAINFSQFNALLNNVDNCHFICGDLYIPIKNEKYDFILSNPPYEISIHKSNLFQDGGKYGYKILQKIIEGVSAHLKKGGFCQIITKIPEFTDKTKAQLFKEWVHNDNLHVFYLELYRRSIYQLAYEICSDSFFGTTKKKSCRNYSHRVNKLLHFLDKINLKSMSSGLITITHDSCFKYVEHIFDGKNIQTNELTSKLQEVVYKHFIYFLGFYGLIYLFRSSLINIIKGVFPFSYNFLKKF
ncbi:hypothetical protein COV53_00195 [Candidatus Gottesmanbacteria bacterium CG11_big_fil_rev_8_21_14_0_20_37_11]|uniref:Methyltransferase small domain-containing protein n=3 Tax=Candidatus Gottesmaniibacteriota TaxID=1752720 RepID=A0A2M7RQ87_9BACT|nr:MAG: hypothetical protein AUJ73_00890 [Candidatus Gottesmanbacteria bacterium CG1_02_37_22]PIP32585.1 MAG: hypothetical protein COX23_03860 [Candidatus Gottesmanbacteria bacterium CG23_combo_of_CG06-09_8_20_14_all_37_19]PIR08978.1 MAG: hypothetical protein COV53_00195 [Candidatus Gottesmanbacteria bacterium CG11_big_fil_rev_8_21_14_0_20_37_11]PIZ02493.1 MAG: hypothetical protein COY59_04445 [Candidatus Gottesmanbacteria bacterium CG_4_10_14_0_8_um_filter_37_24]